MKSLLSLTCVLAAGAVFFPAARAWACGGLFCDGGPVPMPVDQTGEDILFVANGEQVEVHIRIQYEGEAERFAWVIPIQSLYTESGVGSDALFETLKNASVPQYGFSIQRDDCSLPSNDSSPAGTTGGSSAGGDASGDGSDPGGPTVFIQEQVGAFEISVVGESSAAELIDWLNENGYQQDDEALPILEEYLAEGHLFAAIKLTAGADVDEIHPLKLKFDHSEPCVPLRLTRIAALDDMDVRVYFLGQHRVVPQNYRHVLINPLKIDWPNQALNYKEVITLAVDAMHADGRAFVTEFAGLHASTVNPTNPTLVSNPLWDPEAFIAIQPTSVVDELQRQELFFCYEWEGTCAANHPLMDGLLAEFLPVPETLSRDEFYSCLSCYEGLIDTTAWNGQAFADTLRERVVEPGITAAALLTENPYLTRMYTTISPHEMITDPMFHANPDLPDISNSNNATQRILCNGDSLWTLPDGRQVYVPAGQPWPDFDVMPWEEEVQETPASGAVMTLANHTDAINLALAEYNGQFDDAPMGMNDAGNNPESMSEGCGCRTDFDSGRWSVFGLLAGLSLALRRRRR